MSGAQMMCGLKLAEFFPVKAELMDASWESLTRQSTLQDPFFQTQISPGSLPSLEYSREWPPATTIKIEHRQELANIWAMRQKIIAEKADEDHVD
jgi:hypothetical protein